MKINKEQYRKNMYKNLRKQLSKVPEEHSTLIIVKQFNMILDDLDEKDKMIEELENDLRDIRLILYR